MIQRRSKLNFEIIKWEEYLKTKNTEIFVSSEKSKQYKWSNIKIIVN